MKGGSSFSRKEIEELVPIVETYGAKGLMWAKVAAEGWQSPIQKFLTPEEMKGVEETMRGGRRMIFSSSSPILPRWSIRPLETSASIWARSWD